jgi:gluconolactonase
MQPLEDSHLMARFMPSECTTFARGLDHPECVAVGADGSLFAGGEAGEIYRISTDGSVAQFAEALGESGGIALDADGNLYECNLSGHVNRITAQGELTVYSTGTAALPAFFPNYPVFDQHGNLFWTDSGEWAKLNGRIYVVRPDGTTEIAFPDYLGFPNGLALDSDEGWLYVVQSNLHNVVRIRISDGELAGRPEIYAEFSPATVPDGVALTESRDLYVAFYEPNAIYVVEPSGRIEALVEGLTFELLNRPTNVTFARGTTHIYYPNYGTGEVVTLDVGERGLPLHYPRLPTTSVRHAAEE